MNVALTCAIRLSLGLQKEAGTKLLKDFVKLATEGEGESRKALQKLAADVEIFAMKFPLPGVPVRPPSFSRRIDF